MEKCLRVAAYCRVSTENDDQVNSLRSQREYFTQYITQHPGWELSRVYYDEGITGTQTGRRTGFNQMITDALADNFHLILTKEVSRFARNTVDALSYTRKLKEHNVGVIFIIDHIDTRDSDGELRLTIMASMAQEESRKTSERVKWGQKRRMEQGVVFGRGLLGYRVEGGKLYINEEEAPVVRSIFQKYTNEGKGTYVIARELTEQKFPFKQGKAWSNVTVLRILKNEKYVGDLFQKKTITPDYLSHKKVSNQGQEELVCLYNHHPPIICRELWDRTQEELKRRAISPKISQESVTRYSSRSWCSGKILCQSCKSHYIRKIRKRKDGSICQTWKCCLNARYGRRNTNNGKMPLGCDNGSVNEQALLDCMKFVLKQIFESQHWLREEIIQEMPQELQRIHTQTDFVRHREQLHKSIAELEQKKRRAIDFALEGIITKEDLKCQIKRYEEKLGDCRRRLQELDDSEKHTSNFSLELSCDSLWETTICKILDNQLPCELLYKTLLEQIDLYTSNELTIWLKHLPVGIRLTFRTYGKRDTYTTEIMNISFSATRS